MIDFHKGLTPLGPFWPVRALFGRLVGSDLLPKTAYWRPEKRPRAQTKQPNSKTTWFSLDN